jgi:hypothetical protein
VKVQLSVGFSLVRCACGAERQAARRCPSCDREPEETDPDLERRRAIVQRLKDAAPVGDIEPVALEDAFSIVGHWFDYFSAAYEASGEGTVDEAAGRLREALHALAVLETRVSRAQRLRPSHAMWAAVDDVLVCYREICAAYLEALVAPTVEEAEVSADRGQQAIDAGSAALAHFNCLADAWSHVHGVDLADEHADLMAGAEAVAGLGSTTDMVELDRKGADLFARITTDVSCPTGFGVRFQLLELAVDGSMDPKRFWPTARAVYELLARHDVALRGLFDDEDWRRDLTAVAIDVRDAGFEAAAVATAGANRRRLVQSALRLAARQIERAAHPLLATVLAVEQQRRPYASERRRDVNALLTRVAQRGHDALLLGLDPKLRDADAHGEFELDEDGVRLTGSRGRLGYLTDDELVDVTLAGTESIVALYWGLVAALVAAGVDTDELDQAVAGEVTEADKIKFVLLLNGWHDVEVSIGDGELMARGSREGLNAMGLISAIAAEAPQGCETITLVANDATGSHTATGPLAPFLRWSGGDDEQEKEIAFTLASMAWRIDGAPILTLAHSEKVYAYCGIEALNPAVPAGTAMHRLRALIDASRVIDSEELAAALAAALRLRREVATRAPLTRDVDDVVRAFDRWLLVDVPETPSTW